MSKLKSWNKLFKHHFSEFYIILYDKKNINLFEVTLYPLLSAKDKDEYIVNYFNGFAFSVLVL